MWSLFRTGKPEALFRLYLVHQFECTAEGFRDLADILHVVFLRSRYPGTRFALKERRGYQWRYTAN